MIQRVQTIWLFLAALMAFILTRVPLFTASANGTQYKSFLTTESLLLFAVTVITGLLAVVAIFMFKKRPLQMRLAYFGLLASILVIALEVWQIGNFRTTYSNMNGSYAWGSLLPIPMMIFFILALINIRKDEKLVKSLNRFR